MHLVPQWDRYWCLQRVAGSAAASVTVLIAVWWLASLFGLPQRNSLPAYSLTSSNDWLPGLCLVLAVQLLPGSIAAQERQQLRVRALAGQLDAIPRARVPSLAAEASSTNLPLTFIQYPPIISERRRMMTRALGGCLFLLAWALFFTLIALGLIALSVDSAPVFLAGLMSLLLAAFVALLVYYMERVSRASEPVGVRADALGITQLRRSGEGPMFAWDQLQLLELSTGSAGSARYDLYTLYGPEKLIQWRAYRPERTGELASVASDAWAERLTELLALIADQTGLEPRTFVVGRMLTPPPAARRRGQRLGAALTLALIASLGGLLIAAALGSLILPLSANRVLNLYTFATLALAGSSIVTYLMRNGPFAMAMFAMAVPPPHPVAYRLPVVPSADAGSKAGFRLGVLPSTRWKLLIVGLLLGGDLLSGAVAGTSRTIPHRAQLSDVMATLLIGLGLVGVLLVILAVYAAPTRVWADDRGLHEQTRRKRKSLTWDTMTTATLWMTNGQPSSFEVRGGEPGGLISWPLPGAALPWPDNGARTISPEEMAALVVARSGVRLTTKEA